MDGRGVNSSVLDRVKNFLPIIAKANEDLVEQIKKEGQDVVRIDKNLIDQNVKENSEDEDEHNDDKDDEDDDEDNGNETGDGNEKLGNNKAPIINIDFAIGDFDGTSIALAEQDSDDDGEGEGDDGDNDNEAKSIILGGDRRHSDPDDC